MISSTPVRVMLPQVAIPALPEELSNYYLTLLRNLPWPATQGDDSLRAIGVTSCQRHSGASTVALHLAVTAAACHAGRVLLVDGNLAWPSVYRRTGAAAGPGLAELMIEDLPLEQVVQPGPAANLSILTAGGGVRDESAIYDAPSLADWIETFKQTYDLVIFDLPHASETSGGLRLAGLLDGVLLVIESERVRLPVAQRGKSLLQRSQARILGAVMNKFSRHIPDWLYRRL